MTASELRYLIAIDKLCENGAWAKQTELATSLGVTKVSAFNAVERLAEKRFVKKERMKVYLTENGQSVLKDNLTIIDFIAGHLSLHCGTPMARAYEDALNATCAFSEDTRRGVARYLEQRTDRKENE